MRSTACVALVLIVAACESAKKPEAAEGKELGVTATEQRRGELRDELENYCATLITTTESLADEIATETENPELRRLALGWKIRTLRAVRNILETDDAYIGLVDIWAYVLQGLLAFDAPSDMIKPVAPRLRQAFQELGVGVEELARHFFENEDDLKSVKAGVEAFVRANPVRELTRPPLRVSTAVARGDDLPWFGKATSSAVKTIGRELDQIAWVMAWAPTLARWEVALLLEDSGIVESVTRTSHAVDKFQKQSAELPARIGDQVTRVLDDFEKKQTAVQETLRRTEAVVKDVKGIVATVDKSFQSDPQLLASLQTTSASLQALSHGLQPVVKEIRGIVDAARAPSDDPPKPGEPGALVSLHKTSVELTQGTASLHAALKELNSLLKSSDMDDRMTGAARAAGLVVDTIFLRAVWLVLISVAAVVAGALAYRKLR